MRACDLGPHRDLLLLWHSRPGGQNNHDGRFEVRLSTTPRPGWIHPFRPRADGSATIDGTDATPGTVLFAGAGVVRGRAPAGASGEAGGLRVRGDADPRANAQARRGVRNRRPPGGGRAAVVEALRWVGTVFCLLFSVFCSLFSGLCSLFSVLWSLSSVLSSPLFYSFSFIHSQVTVMPCSCVPQMRHKESYGYGLDRRAAKARRPRPFPSLRAVPPHEDKHEKARAQW